MIHFKFIGGSFQRIGEKPPAPPKSAIESTKAGFVVRIVWAPKKP